MQLRSLALAALVATSFSAQADTVALWDFNSFTCTASCTTPPKWTDARNGGELTVIGGASFVSVAGLTGSGMNTSNYAAVGAGNLTRGVQFMIDTSGYTDLVLTFAQRNSSSASAWTTLQYTTDGTEWKFATTFQMTGTTFTTVGKTYDFSSILAANDNPTFGIRLLASFAPGTSAYAGTTAAYATGGTIRYDDVLLTGDAIPDLPVDPLPVPEPQTYALMLAGLATVGLLARRRRA